MDKQDPAAAGFMGAVHGADVGRLRELFHDHPGLSEVVDAPWFSFGKPALADAAAREERALLDALLDLGADPDARSAWEAGPYTALHCLVDGATPERLELAEHLAARGATVDLHAAAGMGRLERIAEILDGEPDRVSEPGPDGATPLHLAKDAEVAELLLDRGAEIDKRCVDHKSTAAMWAAGGRLDVVRLLVDRGAKPDLFLAVLLDDRALAESILEREPEAIGVSVRFGTSHEHLGFGDKYVWALAGSDTPLELAHRHGRAEMYDFLLERSRPADRLVQASRRGDEEAMRRLLGEPGLLPALDPQVLHDTLCGSPGAVRIALEHGADPDVRNAQAGATPLHHAAWEDLRELATTLLDGGADPGIRDRQHAATPLGWAEYANHAGMMDLIAARYEPDLVDAAWLGDMERVRALLAEDPASAHGSADGRLSPLRAAAWYGHVDIVRLLLEAGADPTPANPETGMTALDMARHRNHEAVVRLLSEG